MSTSAAWTIYTDGAARGNPGPAAYSFIIQRPGQKDVEVAQPLGTATNNVAEYTALVRALEHAHRLGGKKLIIKSDSQLMVEQMNGRYQVRNPNILPLYKQACHLVRQFENVTICHIPREENRRADALGNQALDGGDISLTATNPSSKKKSGDQWTEAYRILQQAAEQWSKGDPENPPPDQVLKKLWELWRGKPKLKIKDGDVAR